MSEDAGEPLINGKALDFFLLLVGVKAVGVVHEETLESGANDERFFLLDDLLLFFFEFYRLVRNELVKFLLVSLADFAIGKQGLLLVDGLFLNGL